MRTVLVEDASRFARDLIVQLTGHDYLKKLGVTLIAANAPDHFLEGTPTAVLMRQVLGAAAQFESKRFPDAGQAPCGSSDQACNPIALTITWKIRICSTSSCVTGAPLRYCKKREEGTALHQN